jgi:PKD repeat protein
MKKLLTFSAALFMSAMAFAAGHTVSVTSYAATCFGVANGSATASVSGGTGPFTYSWSPSGGTAATATSLSAGSYTVTVTDNSDMSTATATTVIFQPPALSLGSSGSALCSGSCTTLNPMVSGGTPGYTFSWSGGLFGSTPTVCPSSTTTYTVTVTDANGCVVTGPLTATVITPPVVTVNSVTVCSGSSATLTASGALAYVWNTGATGASISAILPTTTSYTVTGTGSGGCTATAVGTVTVDPYPTVSVPSTYTVCQGAAATLTASATGGPAFSWSPATALSSSTIANPVCAPVATTTYTVTAAFGACTATATTTIYVDSVIIASVTSTNVSDCAITDGSITITPAGGTAPYMYTFAPSITGSSPTMTGFSMGSYIVQVTDAGGCTDTAIVTVFADNSPAANFTIVPDSTDGYNFFMFNSSTGAGLSYSWDWGDGTPAGTSMSPSHYYTATGTMTVCLSLNSSACMLSDTYCAPVTVTGTPASCLALFNIADDTTTSDPNALYIYNLSYGSTLSYLWDFGDGSTSTLATPSHIYSTTGPYTLCLAVDNGSGCTDTYCGTLTTADSLNRSLGLSIQVIDVPPFQPVVTGVQDHTAQTVSVAPNPFNESTVFTLPGNDVYSFELSDVLGKKVKVMNNISGREFSVSRDGLEKGVYIYKISASGKPLSTGKLIIQ